MSENVSTSHICLNPISGSEIKQSSSLRMMVSLIPAVASRRFSARGTYGHFLFIQWLS